MSPRFDGVEEDVVGEDTTQHSADGLHALREHETHVGVLGRSAKHEERVGGGFEHG